MPITPESKRDTLPVKREANAKQLAVVSAVVFAAGVAVQYVGGRSSTGALEFLGIMLWCSPLGFWSALAGAGSKPRKRKQLNSIFWSGVVYGVVVLLIGIGALFSADSVVPAAVLMGVSMLPFGLAIGARRTPVLHHHD